MRTKSCFAAIAFLTICILFFTGCMQAPVEGPSYTVDQGGVLRITGIIPVFEEKILEEQDNVTVSELTFHNLGTPVHTLLASPDYPVASIVFVPGAGVPAAGHTGRAVEYANQGIAFLVMDVRGNGGETQGDPFSIEKDYNRFMSGTWPQTYAVILDIMEARRLMEDRFAAPVYVAGESRGGMYAALAAAADPDFFGYFGVSTGGYDQIGSQYTGDAGRFLKSIDPEFAVGRISPRPVFVLHASPDSVIPFENGKRLARRAGETGQFIPFNGTHGMNEDADRIITGMILTF